MLEPLDFFTTLAAKRPILLSSVVVVFLSLPVWALLRLRWRRYHAQPTSDDLTYVQRQYDRTETGPIRVRSRVQEAAQGGVPAGHLRAWLVPADAPSDRIPLTENSVSIGRSGSNDIILADRTVHRSHAVLTAAAGGNFELHDQGGANGSMVNGALYSNKLLEDGDVLAFGKVEMVYRTSNGHRGAAS